MTTRALVCGGGGVAGVAWEIGVLAGLAEAGVDVIDADVLIGTSAGSVVAAQVSSGLPLPELFARQADPAFQSREIDPKVDMPALFELFASASADAVDGPDERRRIGAVALAAQTVPVADRLAVVAERLPVADWPARPIRLVVVDVATGEPVVLDRTSGAPLVDAVAASCAVPGVWPAVRIGDRDYIDGGVRSGENADLATGFDRVLILQVFEGLSLGRWTPSLADQVAGLRAGGAEVTVITADAASRTAFNDNPLDPATRSPSALAGLAQGQAEAARIAEFWA